MLTSSPTEHFGRLERILELVTEHERVYREQDIRLADLVQKVSDLEVRSATEWAPLMPLKERNITMELDLARAAMETVVRQLAAVTKTNQALQAELRSCQQKQAQQQLAYESTISVLQADLATVRKRVDDVQLSTQAAVDQMRGSTCLQLEQQCSDVQQELQAAKQELEDKLSQAVRNAIAQATAPVQELDGWAKQEILQVAVKLKAVVQSCSNHQQQVNLQMEALQQQWDNTSAGMEALQQDLRHMRKDVARHHQQQTEELQRAAQTPEVMEALQQVQHEVHELAEAHQQLQDWRETVDSNVGLSGTKLQQVDQHVQQLHIQLANQSADLTGLAESVLGCLSAARSTAAQAACAQPHNSYLSSLLGPAAAVPDLSSTSSQQHWLAWDGHLANIDSIVTILRRQQRAGDWSRSMIPQASASSPVR